MTEWLKTFYENYFIKTHVKELKLLKSSLQIKIVTEWLHLVRMMLSKLSNYFKQHGPFFASLLCWLPPPRCSNMEFYQSGCKDTPYGWWIPAALMAFGRSLELRLGQIWENPIPLPQYHSARGDWPVLFCKFKHKYYQNSPFQCVTAGRMVILIFASPQPISATVSCPKDVMPARPGCLRENTGLIYKLVSGFKGTQTCI